MKTYTQEELDQLITCHKKITVRPKPVMILERRNFRNNMRLSSIDDAFEFRVFMRKHEDFSEDFSIGLLFNPLDEREEILLLRCNSPHERINSKSHHYHHHHHHIHIANADDINDGKRKLKNIEITEEYTIYEEALRYFISRVNIENPETHFENILQLTLFPIVEE